MNHKGKPAPGSKAELDSWLDRYDRTQKHKGELDKLLQDTHRTHQKEWAKAKKDKTPGVHDRFVKFNIGLHDTMQKQRENIMYPEKNKSKSKGMGF